LSESKKSKHDLTILLHQIENASKIIASHIKASGLVDILGKTGKKIPLVKKFKNSMNSPTISLSTHS
jgi:hypothetical protein